MGSPAQPGQAGPQLEDPGVAQRLAPGDDPDDAAGVHGPGQLTGDAQGHVHGEVGVFDAGGTVAAAVPAGQVAALGDLEEEIAQVWRTPDGLVVHRQ